MKDRQIENLQEKVENKMVDAPLAIGDKVYYSYTGPHGLSTPVKFKGIIKGFTPQRVKIKAFDGIEYFYAAVKPESIEHR